MNETGKKGQAAAGAVPAAIGGFLLAVAVFYAVLGGRAQIEVHDNLDLFPPQYAILKTTGTWFAQHVTVPFLGGIDRDYLPTELSLVALVYALLPLQTAYVVCYLLKVAIAVMGAWLLLRKGVSEANAPLYGHLRDRVLLCAFAYGALHLFPHFGIAFASLPLFVYLLLGLLTAKSGAESSGKKQSAWRATARWYAGIFLYPFVSYFSYIGFFLLAYLAFATLVCLIRLPLSRGTDEEIGAKKHAALRLLLATLVLAAGYCVFEYRLFRLMLFSGTETIRSQMGSGAGGLPAALRSAWDVFWYGDMHTRSVHLYVVAPVCIFIIAFINKRKINIPRLRLTLHVIAGMILFNSLMYGIDSFAPFRRLVAALFPALEGFQFGRFVFLNPFLWYLLFTLCVCILPQKAGTLIALFACAVAVCMPVPYNDLYHSAHGIYYAMRHDGETPDKMNIGDFYAQDLFSRIKEDIDYDPEDYAVSYGLYPAVAEVNGISTLDGYLGYYPAAYKEAFRRVIAPALARSEASAAYFDGWGARCYLDNGTDESAGMQFRSLPGITDDILCADTGALKDLGCVYVFSRVRLSNAEALQMRLIRAYEDDAQPFHLYVYMLE